MGVPTLQICCLLEPHIDPTGCRPAQHMQAGVRAGDHRLARQDHPAVGHPQAGHHGHADVPQEERARARHAPQRVRPSDPERARSCPALYSLTNVRRRPRAQRCHQSARQRGLEAAQALCGGSACELVLDKAKSAHVHCMFCYFECSRWKTRARCDPRASSAPERRPVRPSQVRVRGRQRGQHQEVPAAARRVPAQHAAEPKGHHQLPGRQRGRRHGLRRRQRLALVRAQLSE